MQVRSKEFPDCEVEDPHAHKGSDPEDPHDPGADEKGKAGRLIAAVSSIESQFGASCVFCD